MLTLHPPSFHDEAAKPEDWPGVDRFAVMLLLARLEQYGFTEIQRFGRPVRASAYGAQGVLRSGPLYGESKPGHPRPVLAAFDALGRALAAAADDQLAKRRKEFPSIQLRREAYPEERWDAVMDNTVIGAGPTQLHAF